MFRKVSSFTEILPLITRSNTIVVCDIDDTVIVPVLRTSLFQGLGRMSLYDVQPTDKHGFGLLYDCLHREMINGKLVFLTARDQEDDRQTRDDLTILGLPRPVHELDIYYTNNVWLKGEFMVRYMRHIIGDKPVIFIDDRIDQLSSVLKWYPYATCIQYIHNRLPTRK